MIVKNNSLLNILIPNENKTLKEVLKEADVKSVLQNKSANVQDVLKNLMDNVTNKTKSHETIQDLLKNSSVFKDLGNFPKDLEKLVKNLPNDEKLNNIKNTLQSFLTHIKDLDENKLKDLVQKSGIFLESKIANSNQNPNIAKLNELLVQVKELIKQDTSPQAKALNALIDKILSQNQDNKISPTLNQDLKQTIQLLKDMVQQPNNNHNKIVQLTQQLENFNQNLKLADSKMQQNILPNEQKQTLQTELKPLLNTLKNELAQMKQPILEPIIKQIDNLLQTKDMFAKNENSVEPKALLQQLTQSPKMAQASQEIPKINNILNTLTQQTQQLQTLENSISKGDFSAQKVQELQQNIKTTLAQLQTALQDVKGVDTKPLMAALDKLISMPNLFSKLELPQSIQQQILPTSTTQNSTSSTVANQTTEATKTSPATTTQATLDTKVTPETSKVMTNSSEATANIKESVKSAETQQNTNITKQESPLMQNDLKPVLNNLSENIKSIITAIKAAIAQLSLQNMPQNIQENFNPFEMQKAMQKLESLFQGRFEQLQQQLAQTTKSPQDVLQEDIKSALLQLQNEASSNSKMQELSKQVDRLLTHIDYYQLLSITSSSNYLYLPFIWDMLEDGSISMKQLQEERYFCEIHLTLKEFGQMDLLLGLYDENHIDISIFSNEAFVKDLIKEHMVELRVGLNKAGLIPQSITVLDLKTQEEPDEPQAVYQHNPYSSDDLGFGVDIKV